MVIQMRISSSIVLLCALAIVVKTNGILSSLQAKTEQAHAQVDFLGNKNFKIVYVIPVVLKSAHNTYFRAFPGGEFSKVDLQTQVGDWEKWDMCLLANGNVAFRSAHGTFLRAHQGGRYQPVNLQTYINAFENFKLEGNGNGKVNIKTFHGFYLRCSPGGTGSLIDQQLEAKEWELIEIIIRK